MAVVGSTITIDLHITEDADRETVRGVVRNDERVIPELASTLHDALEEESTTVLEENGVENYDIQVDLSVVTDRVPGAPRERLTATLDVEGDQSVVASVDEAVSTPERAQVANAVEAEVQEYLARHDLSGKVGVTISVTPIQFR